MPIIGSAVSIRSFGGIGSAAGGEGAVVENVFSSYLYTGNGGSTATINNGIDLSGEGGLVWIKARNAGESHGLFDTTRGVMELLSSDNQLAQATNSGTLTNFYNNGFKVDGNGIVGSSTDPYISWTFRKSPKFFDIVTYTGDSNSQKILSHSLGSDPGMVIIKSTNTNGTSWWTWHRSFGANTSSTGKQMALDSTKAIRDTGTTYSGSAFDWSSPNGAYEQGSYVQGTSSANITVGYEANNNTWQYVAYLFAHNDGDGEFGPNSDQDIIKCGNVAYNGGATVNLGWEPQWVLVKPSDSQGNWILNDNMRGMPASGRGPRLDADNQNQKMLNAGTVNPTATGFTVPSGIYNPTDLIYMAIRRGPMAVPENATDVFAIDTRSSSEGEGKYTSGFPVDFSIAKVYDETSNFFAGTRLINAHLQTNDDVTAGTSASDYEWDHNDGVSIGASGAFFGSSRDIINYMWKRARGFFDVVAYTGNGSTQNINHGLSVSPEMIWLKSRTDTSDWMVSHKDLDGSSPYNYNLKLNDVGNRQNNTDRITAVSSTTFSLGNHNSVNKNNSNFIAYLFATLAGVSKVGSYTGGSSAIDVDCGFTSGARFVLIKNISSDGSWLLFDTARGLVAGNDKVLALENNSAENYVYFNGSYNLYDNNVDWVDPLSSGFTVANTGSILQNDGDTYIFYAIA